MNCLIHLTFCHQSKCYARLIKKKIKIKKKKQNNYKKKNDTDLNETTLTPLTHKL